MHKTFANIIPYNFPESKKIDHFEVQLVFMEIFLNNQNRIIINKLI